MPIAETKNQNCQGSRARAKFLSSFTLISGLFVNTLWSIYVPWYVLSWVLDHSLNFSSAMLVPVLIRAPGCMPQAFCRFSMAHIHDPFFINRVLSNCGSKGWWTSLPSIHAHFIAIAHPYSAARMAYPFHTGFNWSFSFPMLLNIPL